MKIDNLTPPSATGSVADSRRTKSGTSVSTTPAPARSTSDEVTINPLSAQLAQEASDSAPVVDSAKVEEIKAAIREGRFKVNTDVIADRLLASVKELVLARKD